MKSIKEALTLVFRNKKYLLIGTISAIIVGIVFQLLTNITAMIGNNGITFTVISITIGYLTALLIGIGIAFIWYQIDLRRKIDIKTGSTSSGSLFLGILTSGCPVCGTIITSALGIGSGLATLPLKGLELKFLSFGILGVMLVISSKQITKGVCDRCK